MAIIYTYPTKASPAADDLILISDSADSNKTKQIKVSALPSSGAGITLTTTGTSGASTLVGTVLNIPNYTTTGGTLSVQDSGGTVVAGIDTLNFNTDITVVTAPGSSTATVDVSGGSLTVKDEGVDLTTSASSINFTGVGVTATTVGNDVTVDIPDAYVIEDVQLASAVSKGTALYISGPAHGSGRPTVDIADATDNTKMPVVGLALANYSAGEGKMIVTGILDDVNTSNTNIPGGTLGNVIYVDNSGVDNNLTGTKPTGTDLIQNVGIIIKSGANGSIQVACIGRINDLPNLPENDIWLGNSNGVPSNVPNSLDNLKDVSFNTGANGSLYVGQVNANATGLGNVTLGGGAGKVMVAGAVDNTLIGSDAGVIMTEGNNNVAIGSDSAAALTTGNNNVVIGSDVTATLATGTDNVVIGKGADVGAGSVRSVIIGGGASGNNESIAIGEGVAVGSNELGIGEISLVPDIETDPNLYLPIKIKNSSGNMIQYYIKLYT